MALCMANVWHAKNLQVEIMANVWQRRILCMANLWQPPRCVEFPRKEKLGFTELLLKGVENALCSFKTQQVSIPYQTVRSEQTVNNKVRFTTWILPSTDLLITDLAKGMNTTKCNVVEQAVKFYAEGGGGNAKTDDLDVMRKQLNRLQEQNEHLLNILNSLCLALACDGAEFAPADTKPSKWLQESKNIHHQLMLKKKTDKLIKESEYH